MSILRQQDTFQAKISKHENKSKIVKCLLLTNKMDVSKETEQKIGQLQMFEQSLQNFLGQKQQFQVQLVEVESALNELNNAEKAYKIVGNIMVETDKSELNNDLQSRKEMLELRIKTMEKQEAQVREKASKLQSEILKKIKKED